jgi:hypothetical protein
MTDENSRNDGNYEPVIPLWERQPWESPRSFAIFQLYLNQESPRSLARAYREFKARKGLKEGAKIKSAPGSWRNIAQGKKGSGVPIEGAVDFKTRALAFEDHIASLERQKWIERRQSLSEREWKIANDLLEKAELMLAFPVVAQASEDGKNIIMPAGWKLRDIIPVAQTGSHLARLSAGMETENINLNWREEARKLGYDPDELFTQWTKIFTDALDKSNDNGSLEDSPGSPEVAPSDTV